MDRPLHPLHFLANSFWGFICLFFVPLGIQANSHMLVKLRFEISIRWVCWPWIIFKRLFQVVQKLWHKHFYHCPIYFVILQMIRRCPISNLCLIYFTFTLFSFLLSINEYKSKSSSVWEECCGYGYGDLLQMNRL
jgi:hypothetical protein